MIKIYEDVTERELEIARLLAFGMTYSEVGKTLFISENTVKYHISNALQRTGYRNALSLVAHLVANGEIDLFVNEGQKNLAI